MSTQNDGGPAFPAHGAMGEIVEHGMSLRDYFAGKALCGLISSAECEVKGATYARAAYLIADAMLAERVK